MHLPEALQGLADRHCLEHPVSEKEAAVMGATHMSLSRCPRAEQEAGRRALQGEAAPGPSVVALRTGPAVGLLSTSENLGNFPATPSFLKFPLRPQISPNSRPCYH